MDIQTKICRKCKIEKSVECYNKQKSKKDGMYSHCRTCDSQAKKQYRQEYKEKVKVTRKQNYQENKEKVKEYNKQYYQENKKKVIERAIEYIKEKLKINPKFKLDHNMSRAICQSLKQKGLSKREIGWEKAVGYTKEQLKEHLEKQFDDKMTWENQGTYWHVDHIKPKSLFEYDSIDHPEFKKCWSLDNLQPLEAKENIRKSNKYTETNGDNHGISEHLEFVQRQANLSI